jgi:hypothetical protein
MVRIDIVVELVCCCCLFSCKVHNFKVENAMNQSECRRGPSSNAKTASRDKVEAEVHFGLFSASFKPPAPLLQQCTPTMNVLCNTYPSHTHKVQPHLEAQRIFAVLCRQFQ